MPKPPVEKKLKSCLKKCTPDESLEMSPEQQLAVTSENTKRNSERSQATLNATRESIQNKDTPKYRPPHLRPNEHGICVAPTPVDAPEPSQTTESQDESSAPRDYHTCQECPRHIPHDMGKCPIYKSVLEKEKPVVPKPTKIISDWRQQFDVNPHTQEKEQPSQNVPKVVLPDIEEIFSKENLNCLHVMLVTHLEA